MKKETLEHFQDVHLTQIAMIIFMAVFVAVVIWIWRRSSGDMYSYLERLPLEEESHERG